MKALEDRDERLINSIEEKAKEREEKLIEILKKQTEQIQELKKEVNKGLLCRNFLNN